MYLSTVHLVLGRIHGSPAEPVTHPDRRSGDARAVDDDEAPV